MGRPAARYGAAEATSIVVPLGSVTRGAGGRAVESDGRQSTNAASMRRNSASVLGCGR